MDNKTADLLIRKTGQGDMNAFEQLYNELSKGVYALALSIVKNKSAAEDIMQDTFVRVYNAASGFNSSGAGVAWIMRIARNLSITAVSARISEPEEKIDEEKSYIGTEASAVDRLMLENALQALNDNERRIITLHAVTGLKLNEIANILDEPLGTIKWRHSEAMKKLRKSLGEETEVSRR